MKRPLISFILFFLLFSLAAETFSVLFDTGKDYIVMAENEETEKGTQKDKEEKNNDKYSGCSPFIYGERYASAAQVEFFEPGNPHSTHQGYCTIPEQPPRLR